MKLCQHNIIKKLCFTPLNYAHFSEKVPIQLSTSALIIIIKIKIFNNSFGEMLYLLPPTSEDQKVKTLKLYLKIRNLNFLTTQTLTYLITFIILKISFNNIQVLRFLVGCILYISDGFRRLKLCIGLLRVTGVQVSDFYLHDFGYSHLCG